MSIRPVQRIKHVVDQTATLVANTQLTNVIVSAVDAPVLANTSQVRTASTVHGVYLNVEVAVKDVAAGTVSNMYLIVFKNPGGNLTIPVPNAVGSNDNKNYVIHQEMIMMNNATGGNPRTLFKGVIKIPARLKRFGINDQLQWSVIAPNNNTVVCGQTIYKEFR